MSGGTLTITNTSPLPNGKLGEYYRLPITTTGGVSPFLPSIDSGHQPNGLDVSGGGIIDMVFDGTPTEAGVFFFEIKVVDSTMAVATKFFRLTIDQPYELENSIYEQARANDDTVAVWCAEIHFPAFGSLSEKYFYWSTGDKIEIPRYADAQVTSFEKFLQDIPRGRHQTDRGNDYAELKITDVDHKLYQQLLPYQDLLEKCSIVIYECYEAERDYYEAEIKFVGFLKDFTLSDEAHNISLTCLSDMSRSGFLVGNRILTREKCGTEFNANGLLLATDSICGWQTAQGGNATFCSKKLNGADGCKAHLNEHRFYAVPSLATATVQIIPPSGGGGTGGGSGGDGWGGSGSGPCFSKNVHVLMADWTTIPINIVRKDMKHMGFDIFDHDKLVPGEIWDRHDHIVSELEMATFANDTLIEVTKNHLFYLGSRLFAPVGYLDGRTVVGLDSEKKRLESPLLASQTLFEKATVFNLLTSTHNYIVTDMDCQFFVFVHNGKPPILGF